MSSRKPTKHAGSVLCIYFLILNIKNTMGWSNQKSAYIHTQIASETACCDFRASVSGNHISVRRPGPILSAVAWHYKRSVRGGRLGWRVVNATGGAKQTKSVRQARGSVNCSAWRSVDDLPPSWLMTASRPCLPRQVSSGAKRTPSGRARSCGTRGAPDGNPFSGRLPRAGPPGASVRCVALMEPSEASVGPCVAALSLPTRPTARSPEPRA